VAIVIEDGSNVPGANSYATEAQLLAYATARGLSFTAGASVLLITAMDYLESLDFVGSKANFVQPLQWPRLGVQLDGYLIASNVIPKELIEAQIELSLAIDGGVNPLANQARETVREKIAGVIDVEYSPSARNVVYLAAAEAKLYKLVNQYLRVVRV
jgi:hypothetical protein